jgi:hypothetical protein
MSVDNLELILRARMKSHAAVLDRSLHPAPQLHMLLGSPARSARRFGTESLRFGLGVFATLALALAVLSGSRLFQTLPATHPLGSITPAPGPSLVSPSASPASPPPSRASPSSWLISPLASIAVALQPPAR